MASGSVLLRATILAGVIAVGLFVTWERGVLATIVAGDSSYLSLIILALYVIATAHWLRLCAEVSRETDWLARESGESRPEGAVGELLDVLVNHTPVERFQTTTLLKTLEDEVINRHAAGHFIVDALLKLGLLGTIIGFILMLMPIGALTDFDPSMMQRVLSAMSGGMGVSLYTTLVGLVTHLLLRGQYWLLDSAASAMVNTVTRRVLLQPGGDA